MTRRLLYLIAVVAAALAAAAWFALSIDRAGGRRSASMELTSLRESDAALSVADQRPSSRVRIGFVGLAEGGFVVIQEDEGGPGAVIGVSDYLPEGQTRNFDVPLSATLAPGYHYAVLRQDDGDRVFDAKKDPLARDGRGDAVAVRFLVSDEAAPPPTVRP